MAQTNDSEIGILSTVFLNVSESVSSSRPVMHFSLLDYVLFVSMLLLSTFIGLYYGFVAKTKQNTVKEYLLGGKTMHILPISMSLIAS